MKTYKISIIAGTKGCELEFNSALDMSIVHSVIQRVVKPGYRVQIKQSTNKAPETRTLEWALEEALTYRAYHKVCKTTECKIPYTVESSGTIKIPTANSSILVEYEPNPNGKGTLVTFTGFITEEI